MSLYPSALEPGDTICIIAPAGSLGDMQLYSDGCAILSDMGYNIAHYPQKWPGYGYLADSDRNRADELHRAFSDPAIRAIIALRGGFGSLRLLEYIDISVIRKNPKIFVGFSDITILQTCFVQQAGLICLHGPVAASLASTDRPSLERLAQCFRGNWHQPVREDIEVVRGGPSSTGVLCGGNLSSLATLLGTSWAPRCNGGILFLEDVNEPLYRIDRLLTQLKHSGMLDMINGLILGDFSQSPEQEKNERLRQRDFVWHRVLELTEDSGIPIWGNFPAGHGVKNITLPLGLDASMDSGTGILSFDRPKHRD